MNQKSAQEAHQLYSSIDELAGAMRKRLVPGHILEIQVTVQTRPGMNDNWTSMIQGGQLKTWKLEVEVAAFAMRRLNEERQKKINEHGRRLAQLGFEKPEACR